MKKYTIEVESELEAQLLERARIINVPVEKMITAILSRYTISPHILDSEDVKKAYEECGQINLDWSNL